MRPDQRPTFSLRDAERLARRLYGLHARASNLPSERDRNLRLDVDVATSTAGSHAFVLKLFHADEDPAVLDAQLRVMARLGSMLDPVTPVPVPTLDGSDSAMVTGPDGRRHRVCLVPFMPGRPAAEFRDPPDALSYDVGRRLAQIDRELASCGQVVVRPDFAWDPELARVTIRRHLGCLSPHGRRIVEAVVESFELQALPRMEGVRRQLIHADANDHNLLTDGLRVTAILDFGDLQVAWLPCELAHAAAYLMMDARDPVRTVAALARGYVGVWPLTADELAVVYDLARLRLALSVSLSAYQGRLEPDDAYLSISERPAWALLERFAAGEPSREVFSTALARAIDHDSLGSGGPGADGGTA